ncbi:hypothetical protein H5410_005992 [Solanum commersonii]|uniref:Uncharacterized protein n=1 Tax=Solanum commersonii TaxID=4109 RepID=A0A9J6A7Y0_SOLCO|nr:hypothetical protein H5410_005992 [Solanum commersonii]
MSLKDIAEAKYFCKFYDKAKKVELVMMKKCPYIYLIYGDLTTPGVSVKTLVDHIECGIAYDNSLMDYSTIAQYSEEKLLSDPKYKFKEMKADLRTMFDLTVREAKCKRVKGELLETLDGNFVDSYNKLEGYATELRSCNLGV